MGGFKQLIIKNFHFINYPQNIFINGENEIDRRIKYKKNIILIKKNYLIHLII
jgi:hypothetical protein